jgi:Ca2+-transporting ATPase
MVITAIMIGGQILIVFVGGEAFQVTPLWGWEWGASIGLGAVSLPVGVLARMLPDAWFTAMGQGVQAVGRRLLGLLPKRIYKGSSKTPLDEEKSAEPSAVHPRPQRTSSSKKPHRTMSFVRGGRTERSIGFRTWLSEKKEALGDRLKSSSDS